MSLRNFFCALGALVIAGCASSSVDSNIPVGNLPPPDPVALAKIGSAAEYHIGPLDKLDVNVLQSSDLNRTVQVDAAGQISLPLIGALNAAGKTTNELQSEIATRLQAKYFQAPEVNVAVREYASQRVTVDGAVTAPGVYPIVGRTTLLQAVALAKGATREANDKQVVVFRNVGGQRLAARFDLDAIRSGTADDPEIFGNDVVVVDRSGSRGLLREVIGVLPVISIFRPLLF
jgi:polysaccharide export outer membrane protein